MSKKEIAVETLEFNKSMKVVFVTEDKKPFVNENAAVNYSVKNKLKVEEVEKFDRSILESDKVVEPTYQELKDLAKELGYEVKGNPKTEDLVAFIESKKED